MRTRFRCRRLGARAICVAAVCGLSPLSLAAAVQRSYTGANNGLWGTASNWTPAGVPANGDTAVVSLKANTGINVDFRSIYSAPGLAQVTVDAPGIGAVGVTETTGATDALVAGSEFIGLAHEGAGTAQFTQRIGTNQVTGTLVVGEGAGSRGLYILGGGTNSAGSLVLGDADATASGTYKLTLSGVLHINGNETIANLGSGVLTQTGGSNTVKGNLLLADQASGKGAYNIFSGTLSAAGETFGPGAATFTEGGGSNTVGSGGLSISAGGTAASSYSLTGGSLTTPSEIIGANGTLSQSGNGVHSVTGTLTVGDGTGGTLSLSGGKLTPHALVVSTGGTATVAGGTLAVTDETIGNVVGRGSVTQTGGTHTVANSLVFGTVTGGQGGYVFSGGTLTIGGSLLLAQAMNGSGNFSMGSGAILSAAGETIGVAGLGTFTQTGGDNFVHGVLALGALTGGDGIYFLSDGTVTAASLTNNGTFAQTGGTVAVGPVTGTGTLSVGGGPTQANFKTPSFTQNRVGISQNATLALAASASTSLTNVLTVSGGGKLDLANNAVMVQYGNNASPAADLAADLASAYDMGNWDGPGIGTTAADAAHGLGFADGADGAVAGLAPDTVLIKYARYGDANLDGVVNFDDLLALAQHYGSTTPRWDAGDFNYDGQVNFNDLLLLAQNYGLGATTALSVAPVPEPGAVVLLPCLVLAARRRRRM